MPRGSTPFSPPHVARRRRSPSPALSSFASVLLTSPATSLEFHFPPRFTAALTPAIGTPYTPPFLFSGFRNLCPDDTVDLSAVLPRYRHFQIPLHGGPDKSGTFQEKAWFRGTAEMRPILILGPPVQSRSNALRKESFSRM